VINTNLAAAVAMISWMVMDMAFSADRKPTFLGGVNGMICGLVGITPAAGYVNGVGAIIIGLVTAAVVWVLFGYLPTHVWPFNKVDDALGVVYTHGFAGLLGGLLVGLLADPKMVVYLGIGKNPDAVTTGLFYGHPRQLLIQAGAALTVIVWDGLVTFAILRGIALFTKLRMSDSELAAGDILAHGEVAYPMEEPEAEPDFGPIPGEPVPVHHHHHELVTSDGKVLVTSGGKARSPGGGRAAGDD
jgi:ammonium transporter, Amt family